MNNKKTHMFYFNNIRLTVLSVLWPAHSKISSNTTVCQYIWWGPVKFKNDSSEKMILTAEWEDLKICFTRKGYSSTAVPYDANSYLMSVQL